MCFYVLPSHDRKYLNLNEYKTDTNQNNSASYSTWLSGRGPGFKFHLT